MNTTATTPSSSFTTHVPAWWVQVIWLVAFISMVVVAAGGNIIVIWIVVAHKRMRTVTNYFLVNLAVADTLISIFNTFFNSMYMLYQDWPFGMYYCKFSMFITTCSISASVFTFMAIAIDRYVAIIHPLKPRLSSTTVILVITVIWITSTAIAMPNLIYARTSHQWGSTLCILDWPGVEVLGKSNKYQIWYDVLVMFVNYIIPLGILTVTYIRIGRELWDSQTIGEYTARQEENIRSKRKVVKMMIVVVLIFAICWLPQNIFFLVTNVYQDLLTKPGVHPTYLFIFWLAMSNQMYNPIIYCWMNARFRYGFKYVFRWLPCISWHPNQVIFEGPTTKVSVRISMSEGTHAGYDRNGSMMNNTVVENFDETSYAPCNSTSRGATGFQPMRKNLAIVEKEDAL